MNRRGFLGLLLGAPIAATVKPEAKATFTIAPDNRHTFEASTGWIRIKSYKGTDMFIPVWK